MYLATTPGLTRFTYHFIDDAGHIVGQLRWPDVAVATNARMKKVYPKSLNRKFMMELGEEAFEIEFEYLSRGMENDIQFRLVQGQDLVASADVLRPKTFLGRQPTIRIDVPFSAELINRGRWYSLRYDLEQDGAIEGAIYEASKFSLKRRITIDLPDEIIQPVQFFLFFLVANAAY